MRVTWEVFLNNIFTYSLKTSYIYTVYFDHIHLPLPSSSPQYPHPVFLPTLHPAFCVVINNSKVQFMYPLLIYVWGHSLRGRPLSGQRRVTMWEVFEYPCTQAQPQKLIP